MASANTKKLTFHWVRLLLALLSCYVLSSADIYVKDCAVRSSRRTAVIDDDSTPKGWAGRIRQYQAMQDGMVVYHRNHPSTLAYVFFAYVFLVFLSTLAFNSKINFMETLGLVLFLSGGIGNFASRYLFSEGVPDFIFSYVNLEVLNYPLRLVSVMNLADIYVFVSFFLIFLSFTRRVPALNNPLSQPNKEISKS